MVKNNSTKKSKFIILIALVLVLVGIVIFVILYRPGGVLSQNVQEGIDTNEPAQPGAQNPTSPDEPKDVTLDKRYLVLEDWGVRFTIPEGLEGVKYYKKHDWGYYFTTERVEAIGSQDGDICDGSSSGAYTLVAVSRTKEALPKETDPKPLPNTPIDGYYYYWDGSHSVCSDKSMDIQTEDRKKIETMVQTIAPVR